jgi:2-phosphoglycerate kinase
MVGLPEIRMIQEYIVDRARRNDVPVIENEGRSDAIGAVMELVLASAERRAEVTP